MKTLDQIADELNRIARQVGYGNPLPTDSREWKRFAEMFDVGVLDLDKMARYLGYGTYKRMKRQTPHAVFEEKGGKKFIEALRDVSLLAYGMNDHPLNRQLQKFVK